MTDTLTLVVDAVSLAYSRGGEAIDNLLDAAARDAVEVRWGIEADGESWADAYDTDAAPCWDRCSGITETHRPGWCLVNPEHADLDCGCGEVWHDDDEATI